MEKGNYVIVRGNRSGVFAGYLEKRKGQDISLSKARKLWHWSGACAVEQIAKEGVKDQSNCKFTVVVDEITITDAIQVIPATIEAKTIIEGVSAWEK